MDEAGFDQARIESWRDSRLLFGQLTYDVVGAAFEVMRVLGPGLIEKPYENSLVVEMKLRKLKVDQQRCFALDYKGVKVGDYIPDLIVGDAVIVDTKVIEHIGDYEIAQMLNYLRITGLRVGLIINFKRSKVEFERLIL